MHFLLVSGTWSSEGSLSLYWDDYYKGRKNSVNVLFNLLWWLYLTSSKAHVLWKALSWGHGLLGDSRNFSGRGPAERYHEACSVKRCGTLAPSSFLLFAWHKVAWTNVKHSSPWPCCLSTRVVKPDSGIFGTVNQIHLSSLKVSFYGIVL